jgi:hypothetical protein
MKRGRQVQEQVQRRHFLLYMEERREGGREGGKKRQWDWSCLKDAFFID